MAPSFMKSVASKCSLCVRLFKWFPVLIITTVIAWSYYAYVIHLCLFTVESIVKKVFYLITYHALFAIFSWAYWQTIFTDIARVPQQFKLPVSEAEKIEKDTSEDNQRRMLESFSRDLPVNCRTMNGAIRYCEKCHHIKPDRAHHCSVCGVCVLKMDHHCPWVNNCVSFTNYKFFILFLGYALAYCLFVATTSLQYFIRFWTDNHGGLGRFHILFIFFVSVMFAISLVSLFVYHCFLVSKNRSTLESFRPPIFRTGPDKDGFSLGRNANFVEVFGDNRLKWFLPVYTSLGDGIVFPTRNQVLNTYNSMGSTSYPSNEEERHTYAQHVVDMRDTEIRDTDELLNQQQCWAEEADEQSFNDMQRLASTSGTQLKRPTQQMNCPV